jgi:hypothetical protein
MTKRTSETVYREITNRTTFEDPIDTAIAMILECDAQLEERKEQLREAIPLMVDVWNGWAKGDDVVGPMQAMKRWLDK